DGPTPGPTGQAAPRPPRHRRWAEGCHDAAVLHAEITALGYRGSLRTVYRYLQPLRAGTPPAALTPSALKIGEVTSWLLRRAEDLSPASSSSWPTCAGTAPSSTASPGTSPASPRRWPSAPENSTWPAGWTAWTPTTSPNCTPSPPGSARTWPRSPPG